MKKEVVAMLLAGGQGSRLYALTSHMAKPAVPFGGKYRIIDFPLSNCVNSGIDTVGVLTQYRPLELNSYIGNGQPWDLDRSDGGVHILPPYMVEGDRGTWYKGTANAIYQNMDFIEQYDPDYVVVLSGDHIYKMDYSQMVDLHKRTGAACTISVLQVTLEEAKRFGIMNVDENDRIYQFEEKPPQPKSTLASMGIYVFTWSKLRQYLLADEADPSSANDFGKNIIPAMLAAGEKLMAYRFQGYWKDVGTIDSLWDANMDLLAPRSSIDLYDASWPIYARTPVKPPPLHRAGRPCVPLPAHRRLHGGRQRGKLRAVPLRHCGAGGSGGVLHPHARRGGKGRGKGVLRHRGRGRYHRGKRPGGRPARRQRRLGRGRGSRRRPGGRRGQRAPQRHAPGRCERR